MFVPRWQATLSLSSSEATLKLWPFSFLLSFTIAITGAGQLSTSLRIENTGSSPFDFQTLLHTYFAVAAIEHVRHSESRGGGLPAPLAGCHHARTDRDSMSLMRLYVFVVQVAVRGLQSVSYHDKLLPASTGGLLTDDRTDATIAQVGQATPCCKDMPAIHWGRLLVHESLKGLT